MKEILNDQGGEIKFMLQSSITPYSPLQFGAPNLMYQEFTPVTPLLPYIDCYWVVMGGKLRTTQQSTLKVLPDGCIDIVFRKCHSSGYVGTITGAMNEYMDVPISGEMFFIGVRFRPGGMRAIFQTVLIYSAEKECIFQI